jgi:hypothetical protein
VLPQLLVEQQVILEECIADRLAGMANQVRLDEPGAVITLTADPHADAGMRRMIARREGPVFGELASAPLDQVPPAFNRSLRCRIGQQGLHGFRRTSVLDGGAGLRRRRLLAGSQGHAERAAERNRPNGAADHRPAAIYLSNQNLSGR